MTDNAASANASDRPMIFVLCVNAWRGGVKLVAHCPASPAKPPHAGAPPSRDITQGEKRRFYKHNFDLDAAAKPVSTQETLNWRAFSVGGQPMPPPAMTSKGRAIVLRFTRKIFLVGWR